MNKNEQKIIVLIDGSMHSTSVCEHAAWMAHRSGAPVELIHVLGRREASDMHDHSGAIALGARTTLLKELAELDAQRAKLIGHRGRAILEDARAMLENAGVSDVTTRLRYGDLVEAVAEVEGDARVIVIGKRGEAADFAKDHLGSNLERIVRASHRPVFVAPPSFKPISSVLVAYDGGNSAMKAVSYMAGNRVFQGLKVEVVTVGNATAEASRGLEDARALLKDTGIEAGISILNGQPEAALGKFIEERSFDLLVMGAYGHSRIRNLIIGSTTTEMMRSCQVPIVLVH